VEVAPINDGALEPVAMESEFLMAVLIDYFFFPSGFSIT